jgi:hypothetical protein
MYKFLFPAVLAIALPCLGAPEPTLSNVPNLWTLDSTFENIQPIFVRVPGAERPLKYWYMILTVTNKTGKDIEFYPKIELTTDTLQTVLANKDSRKAVFDRIRTIHQGKYPFIEPLEFADHKVLQGSDNTRDFAVIFPDFDPNAKTVKVFVAGLSNETSVIDHPTLKEPDGSPKKIVLRKTLEIDYAYPGDPTMRANQGLTYVGKKWVMR